MWSSRLFWKLFATFALLNLAATVTFVTIVSRWQQDQLVQMLTNQLRDSAALVRGNVLDDFPIAPNQSVQQRIEQLGKEIHTRITLVAMDGKVLADSDRATLADVVAMENHKDRVELVQAAKLGQGSSQRVSPTLGQSMLYVALRADHHNQPAGMVRLALPMTLVQEKTASILTLIWLVGGMISVSFLVLSYIVAARVVRPVATLTSAAESIAAGDYQQHVYVQSKDEIGTLARSFNRMNDQLKSRETQLRESTQRLSTVLEGMAEGVVALDDRQRIVLANAAAGRLLGFAPQEAEARSLLEVVRNHTLHKALVDAQAAQESRRIEIEMAEGEHRFLSIYATLVPGDRATRFILVIADVTELKRLESMRQEFVANVSHELKTPLSAIKAYAETLSQGAIDDAANNRRFVHGIEDQAERLHQLILDLLSLARIESGQQAFEIAAVNLEKIVLACLSEHQTNAEAKEVTLAVTGDQGDLQVRADEEGTRQILNNLINNAINYTPCGGGVTVRWQRDNGFGVLEVADTGIGIATEHLPRLFERFYRVDKARSRELGGTGLGLSIVKHLTQSFGGTVEVESQPGEGSKFTVKLPLA